MSGIDDFVRGKVAEAHAIQFVRISSYALLWSDLTIKLTVTQKISYGDLVVKREMNKDMHPSTERFRPAAT